MVGYCNCDRKDEAKMNQWSQRNGNWADAYYYFLVEAGTISSNYFRVSICQISLLLLSKKEKDEYEFQTGVF